LNVDLLKQEVSCIRLALDSGIQLDSKNSGLCPTGHESTSGRCAVYHETFFKCFSCDEGGDVVKLAMLLHGYSFKESILFLCKKYAPHLITDRCTETKPHVYSALYRLSLKNAKKANVVLAQRNISAKAGYIDDVVVCELRDRYSLEELQDNKLFKDGNTYIEKRVVLPIKKDGSIIGLILRGENPKSLILCNRSNSEYLFNFKPNKKHHVLTEGEYDALSVQRAGYTSCALLGSSKISAERLDLFKNVERIDLMFDNDKAGQKALFNFFYSMQGILDHVDVRVCIYKKGDPNECSDEEIQDAVEGSTSIWSWAVDELTSTDLDTCIYLRARFIKKFKPVMTKEVFDMMMSVIDSRLRYVR